MADPHSPNLKFEQHITPAQSEPMRDLPPYTPKAPQATGGCGCGPEQTSRELYWIELSPEQKLERMRMMVRRAITNIGELEEKVERLSNLLLQHTHNPIGQIQKTIQGEDLRPRRTKEHTLRSLGLDRPTDEDYF